jgi:hypothetical protein
MKGEVLIAGVAGIIIGAVAVTLILAGAGFARPVTGQSVWPGISPAGWGMGMMGPGMMGQGMMPGFRGPARADSVPISPSEAGRRASDFASRLGEGYVAEDLMGFTENYYAVIEEEESGAPVTEILVDRYTGQVSVEPGPAMMWGIRGSRSPVPASFDSEAARSLGEAFLSGYLPGAKILETHAFPGYYTFDFGRGGTEGMLSVNAYSGAIWVHTWHGLPLEPS